MWIPESHPSGRGARESAFVASCPGDSDLYWYLRTMFYNLGMYLRLVSIEVYISASLTPNSGGSVDTKDGERNEEKWGIQQSTNRPISSE